MNPQDEVIAKMQAEKQYLCQAQTQTPNSGVAGCRTPNPLVRAEQDCAYHTERASNAARAANFFREHPEFAEFIELIRTGVIGI